MRAGLDGALAVILDPAAPENGLAFFVRGLQFQPNVEGIDSTAGEKVADLARSNDHVHANIIAAAHRSVGSINGRRDRAKFASRAFRQRGFRLFSNSKSRRELLFAQLVANRRRGFFPSRRDGENIHAELLVLKKALREFVLRFVPVGGGNRGPGRSAIRIRDRKSTRLNSSHRTISYAVFCLKKKKKKQQHI